MAKIKRMDKDVKRGLLEYLGIPAEDLVQVRLTINIETNEVRAYGDYLERLKDEDGKEVLAVRHQYFDNCGEEELIN